LEASVKFKKRDEPVWSSDLYYDLFLGGYIEPSDLLADPGEAAEVDAAVATVQRFLDEARETGVLGEM
jgi:hypothetical protein